jgi:hypothetical protein
MRNGGESISGWRVPAVVVVIRVVERAFAPGRDCLII